MKECCKNVDNLKVIESTATTTVQQCKVCGAKHYEMTVAPIHFGVDGKGM